MTVLHFKFYRLTLPYSTTIQVLKNSTYPLQKRETSQIILKSCQISWKIRSSNFTLSIKNLIKKDANTIIFIGDTRIRTTVQYTLSTKKNTDLEFAGTLSVGSISSFVETKQQGILLLWNFYLLFINYSKVLFIYANIRSCNFIF